MTLLKVGIADYETMKARTLAIARGEARDKPDGPRIWFASMESFARVLSDRNRTLLRLIAENSPESLKELAALSGREKSNLSRTLKTFARYGLVDLHRRAGGRIAARVPYTDIVLDVPLVPRDAPSADAA